MTATVPQVLRDAAELQERLRFWRPTISIVYWIIDVLDDPSMYGPADERRQLYRDTVAALADYVDLGTCPPAVAVRDWEDTQGRTTAEVLAALRGAADAWEAEHG